MPVGEGLGEGQFRASLVHVLFQCFRTGHALGLQAMGQVDALAVLVQPHQHGHVTRRDPADAQVHRVDQPIQAVGGIDFAADQLVAQVGPGGLALEVQGQAVGLGEALGGGHDERGTVAQGHETEVDRALFRGIAAVDPGQGVGWNFIHRYHLPHKKAPCPGPGGRTTTPLSLKTVWHSFRRWHGR